MTATAPPPEVPGQDGVTVSDVGEDALIQRILDRLPPAPAGELWSGDDAAILRLSRESVVTTDCLVEGVDFRFDHFTGADAAWKAVAANVSDVAAMGCRPSHAVVTVGIPSHAPLALFDSMLDGLQEAAGAFGVDLVGGDISEARDVFLSITMIGSGTRPVLRGGAKPGEVLCVTGALGGAAGGLLVLDRGLRDPELAPLVRRQVRPQPDAARGEALAAAGATSMIDVSDGLAVDLGRLLDAAGVGCVVDASAVPLDPALPALQERVPEAMPLDLAVLGGEDFELLFTIPSDLAEGLTEADVGAVSVLGEISTGDRSIAGRPLDEWKEAAWQHLRAR